MLLYFTEAPEPSLSTVSLLDSAGQTVPGVGKPAVAPGNARELRVALPRLAKGVYTVNWRTVSKVDGHVTSGSFAFGIGVQAPAGVLRPRAAVRLGGLRPVSGRRCRPVAAVLGAGAARCRRGDGRAGLQVAAAREGADGDRGRMAGCGGRAHHDLFGAGGGRRAVRGAVRAPPPGGRCWLRPLPWPCAGWSRSTWRAARRARRLAVLAAAAAAALFVHAQAGHAETQSLGPAAQRGRPVAAHARGRGVDRRPGLAAAGAPGPARAERASAVRRFSQLAFAAVALIAVTGVLRAVPEVGSLGALVSTGFGVTLLIKSGLFVVLMAIAWRNRYRLVPKLAEPAPAARAALSPVMGGAPADPPRARSRHRSRRRRAGATPPGGAARPGHRLAATVGQIRGGPGGHRAGGGRGAERAPPGKLRRSRRAEDRLSFGHRDRQRLRHHGAGAPHGVAGHGGA